MSGEKIVVQGLKELVGAFRKTPAELRAMVKETNRAIAEKVAEDARGKVPSRSGRLARTIRVSATAYAGIVRAGNNTTVPYAGPIHFGWVAHNIEPQPFLYDALDARRGEVIAAYHERLDSVLAKSGSKP